MKQLLTNLSNTINEDLVIPFVSNEIEIREERSKCKKITLKSRRKNIFAFSLDKNLDNRCKMFPFFNQKTKIITKANDGIVFYIDNNEIYILLCELKSNRFPDYKEQLEAGKSFVYFLLAILNNAFPSTYTIKEENIKCLVFSLRKTPRKYGTKRNNIEYKVMNGLNIGEFQCNDNHNIEKFIL